MYRRIIKDNLYAVLIGVLSLVLGVTCIVACLYMKAGKTEKIYRALRNLGVCILTEGIWVVTDSQILLLVTQHTSIIGQGVSSFLSFFTLPLPLLGFIKEIMPGKHRMLSVMRKLFVFYLSPLSVKLYQRM